MLISLASRLLLLVLVSSQTYSTLFLVLALGLVNTFILKDTLMLIALSDTPPEVFQLLRTLGKHLLSPFFFFFFLKIFNAVLVYSFRQTFYNN